MTEDKPIYEIDSITDELIAATVERMELAKAGGAFVTIIGDDEQTRLDAIAELHERCWKQCAAKLHEYRLLNNALPEEYQLTSAQLANDVAGHRWKANTVRSYYGIWRGVYDEDAGLFDEFPQFGWSHWREIVMAARRDGTKVSKVAMKWAETEDDHGGSVIWPDALSAKLHAPKNDKPPFIQDIQRAANNLARALKHCDNGYRQHAVATRTIAAMIEDLQKAIEKR